MIFVDINELIKKYPINDVGEESDPRDYDIDMLECASNVAYDAMLTNCITPDGYRVDKNGVWIK